MAAIIVNGIQADYISALDRGLHYGDGLFETIACVDHSLQFWAQHMERMASAAEKLKITFPGEVNFLQDIRTVLALPGDSQNCVIKLVLTRGSGERGYRSPKESLPCRMVLRSDWSSSNAPIAERGARLYTCTTQIASNPQLAGIKHLNRLENVLARNEWQDDYDEGLMCDAHNHLIEGTMSNVFALANNVLYTPTLDQCGVDGIIRQQIISLAAELDLTVQETTLTQATLVQMDEIFLTNSVIGLWPVSEFAGNTYAIGDTTLRLAKQLTDRMKKYALALG